MISHKELPLRFAKRGAVPGLSAPRNVKGMTMKNFLKMLKDESGASAAEYALILAIVGTAIAAAAITLGGAISDSMTGAASCIRDPGVDGANCGPAAAEGEGEEEAA